MPKKVMCCLCYKTCESEYGNNPLPIVNTLDSVDEHLRCCNICNKNVIRERLQVIVACLPKLKEEGGKHRIIVDGSKQGKQKAFNVEWD